MSKALTVRELKIVLQNWKVDNCISYTNLRKPALIALCRRLGIPTTKPNIPMTDPRYVPIPRRISDFTRAELIRRIVARNNENPNIYRRTKKLDLTNIFRALLPRP